MRTPGSAFATSLVSMFPASGIVGSFRSRWITLPRIVGADSRIIAVQGGTVVLWHGADAGSARRASRRGPEHRRGWCPSGGNERQPVAPPAPGPAAGTAPE